MPCNKRDFIIRNASVVTPGGILKGASLRIEDGIIVVLREGEIKSFLSTIDAEGMYVLPGFVDLHSDAIEKGIEPRPNVFFPVNIAVYELDKKLSSCGITTMFHSLSFAEMEIGLRSNSMAAGIVREINALSGHLKVRTKIHARYEITDSAAIPFLEALIKDQQIHLLSVMDHTPGQGQFRGVTAFKGYYGRVYRKNDEELDSMISRKLKVKGTTVIEEGLQYLIDLCKNHGIPLASHDDDSPEKIRWLKGMGLRISEFPVSMEAVMFAAEEGFSVCLGAPNILRGASQSGNLSARDAILEGFGDIICSDYAPMALLYTVFTIYHLGILPLHEAVNMVSINPAEAVGLGDQTGSIEEGKECDIVIVDVRNGVPQVLKTFISGREVYSTCLR